MQNKNYLFKMALILSLFILTGCFGEQVESSDATLEDTEIVEEVIAEEEVLDLYEEAIENGEKELDRENYEEAISYFEKALEERPEDKDTVLLLTQIELYIEAMDLFESENFEESRMKLAGVQSLERGSNLLFERAEKLRKDIETRETAIREEKEALEAAEAARKAEEAKVAAEKAEQEAAEAARRKAEQKSRAYSEFVGYYLHYNSADRSHSDMIVTIGYEYLTIGWWMSEFELYDVLDYSIHDNILTIDYYLHPYVEGPGEYGTLSLYLLEENGQKYIDFGSDMPFYKEAYEVVGQYGYTIQDYLFNDIHR